MRLRSTAAGLAVVTVSGLLAVGTAHAATGSGAILSVDNSSAARCSDETTDSSTTPYCTIQAAVNAAAAGDTVQVKAGDVFTGETDVTKSGTAEAPITIEAVGGYATIAATNDQYGFYLDGAQYVNLSGFTVEYAASGDVQLSGAQHIDISGMRIISAASPTVTKGVPTSGVGFYQTSDSRVSTSIFIGAFGSAAVNLYGGGAGRDVVTTNVLSGQRSNAISDVAVPDVAITSNTVVRLCGNGISVSAGEAGSATGSTIENNVLADFLCGDNIAIQGDSSEVSAADYNLVYPNQSTSVAYDWAQQGSTGNSWEQYTSASAFCSATTYGCHDLDTDPYVDATGTLNSGQVVSTTSPVIDSANSDAPGELATDFAGNARTNDPNVTDTGVGKYTYYDRGAYQYQDPFAGTGQNVLTMNLRPTDALGATAAVNPWVQAWGKIEYTYDFGDGTDPVTTASTSSTHHYAKLGTYTVTVTGVDAAGAKQTLTSTVTTAGSEYTAFGPTRILDTRKGIGAPKGQVGYGATVPLQVLGAAGLPTSGITAVALHVTAVDTTGNGFISVNPDGMVDSTSLLNYGTDQTVFNSVIVPLPGNGQINLTNSGVNHSVKTDLIADVTGYFTGKSASGYTSVDPARLLDTRSGQGGTHAKVAGSHAIQLTIAGADRGALPASGITAVALNLTAVDGNGNGFVTAYQDGLPAVPSTSNLNYAADQTVASEAIVPVGTDGKIDLYVGGATTQSVDLIADVQGYYSADGASAYVPLGPQRVIDTRKTGALAQDYGTVAFDPLNLGSDVAYTPLGLVEAYALPTDASAWDFNLTAVQGTGHGLITAYPVLYGQTPVPAVSNLNYAPGQTVANYAQVTGGPADPWQSSVDFTNSNAQGTVQLIADLYGFYSAN